MTLRQREAFVHSLDLIVWSMVTTSFLLDTNTINFVIRATSEIQCSAPKNQPDRTLRFFVIPTLVINLGVFAIHCISAVPGGTKTVVLDFIGQTYKPTRAHLLLLDLLIGLLQVLLVSVAYENARGDQDEESDADQSYDDEGKPSPPETEPAASLAQSDPPDQPIFDFQLKSLADRMKASDPLRPLLPISSDPNRRRRRGRRRRTAEGAGTGQSAEAQDGAGTSSSTPPRTTSS